MDTQEKWCEALDLAHARGKNDGTEWASDILAQLSTEDALRAASDLVADEYEWPTLSPLSGEWAGESISELFGVPTGGELPDEDTLDEYEANYANAFREAAHDVARLALFELGTECSACGRIIPQDDALALPDGGNDEAMLATWCAPCAMPTDEAAWDEALSLVESWVEAHEYDWADTHRLRRMEYALDLLRETRRRAQRPTHYAVVVGDRITPMTTREAAENLATEWREVRGLHPTIIAYHNTQEGR
jgi:hypothetical protein